MKVEHELSASTALPWINIITDLGGTFLRPGSQILVSFSSWLYNNLAWRQEWQSFIWPFHWKMWNLAMVRPLMNKKYVLIEMGMWRLHQKEALSLTKWNVHPFLLSVTLEWCSERWFWSSWKPFEVVARERDDFCSDPEWSLWLAERWLLPERSQLDRLSLGPREEIGLLLEATALLDKLLGRLKDVRPLPELLSWKKMREIHNSLQKKDEL